MTDRLPLLKGKITAPPLPDALVDRPRLTTSISRRLSAVPTLVVCAAAGAGKTTAVHIALREVERLAWLTLDDADGSPGRLLTYLAAALDPHAPGALGLVRSAMEAQVPDTEIAGLVVEHLASVGPTSIVIDQVDRIVQSPRAMELLDSLVRFLPPEVHLILISRTAFTLPAGSDAGRERLDYVIDRELAFTEQETAEALRLAGDTASSAAHVQSTTGGWVIGVLFAGSTSARTVLSLQPEIDPLHAYLRAHVLEMLRPELREFMITTSLLVAVDAELATDLGIERAEALLTELRAHRMPVVWEPGGKTVRYHPVLRDYLLLLLGRRPNGEVRELRTRFARMLREAGFLIEATEELLSLEAYDEALPLAEVAIFSLIERRDYDVADRWLDLLAHHGDATLSPLTTAELVLAVAREEYWRGVRIADQLEALERRDELAARSSTAAAMMIWCYYHACRTEDIRRLVSVAAPGPEMEAAGALASLIDDTPLDLPLVSDSPAVGGLLVRLQYWNGLLAESAAQPEDGTADGLKRPWRIAALRAMGDLEEALRVYRRLESAGMLTCGLLSVVGVELFTDLGQADDAREAAARGLAECRRAGSLVWEIFGGFSMAKLELRLERDAHRGLETLRRIEAMPEARRYRSSSEHLDTWFGYAHLLLGEADAAYERLDRAVGSMRRSGRLLELPTAAVYLAEAAWARGEEDRADALLDVARDAARIQRTDSVLVRALREFPDTLARKLDGMAVSDPFWGQLGERILAPDAPARRRSRLRIALDEFGTPTIEALGAPVRPRIAKCAELLAYLASTPDLRADRAALLDALFDGVDTDASRSYLRQTVHQLRAALPEGTGPTLADGVVSFSGDVGVDSAADRMLRTLRRSATNDPDRRLSEIDAALAIAAQGAYLAKSKTAWADERRREIGATIASLQLEAAHLAFDLGRYPRAAELAESVVRAEPLRESAWRLRMRVAATLGSFDDVLSLYADCTAALSGMQAQPTHETRALLEQLRR